MINDRPRLHGGDRDFEERGLVIDFTAVETKMLRRKVPAYFGILAKRVGEEKRYLYIVIVVVVVRWLNDSRGRRSAESRSQIVIKSSETRKYRQKRERKSCLIRGEDRHEKKSKDNEVKAAKKSESKERRKWISKIRIYVKYNLNLN